MDTSDVEHVPGSQHTEPPRTRLECIELWIASGSSGTLAEFLIVYGFGDSSAGTTPFAAEERSPSPSAIPQSPLTVAEIGAWMDALKSSEDGVPMSISSPNQLRAFLSSRSPASTPQEPIAEAVRETESTITEPTAPVVIDTTGNTLNSVSPPAVDDGNRPVRAPHPTAPAHQRPPMTPEQQRYINELAAAGRRAEAGIEPEPPYPGAVPVIRDGEGRVVLWGPPPVTGRPLVPLPGSSEVGGGLGPKSTDSGPPLIRPQSGDDPRSGIDTPYPTVPGTNPSIPYARNHREQVEQVGNLTKRRLEKEAAEMDEFLKNVDPSTLDWETRRSIRKSRSRIRRLLGQ